MIDLITNVVSNKLSINPWFNLVKNKYCMFKLYLSFKIKGETTKQIKSRLVEVM